MGLVRLKSTKSPYQKGALGQKLLKALKLMSNGTTSSHIKKVDAGHPREQAVPEYGVQSRQLQRQDHHLTIQPLPISLIECRLQ